MRAAGGGASVACRGPCRDGCGLRRQHDRPCASPPAAARLDPIESDSAADVRQRSDDEAIAIGLGGSRFQHKSDIRYLLAQHTLIWLTNVKRLLVRYWN